MRTRPSPRAGLQPYDVTPQINAAIAEAERRLSVPEDKKLTLLIDFDGTIAKYDGWKGPEVCGDPLEKARAALYILSRDYHLVYFTTRDSEVVEKWIHHWGFPKSKVSKIKDPAHLIIDDRAIQFKGEWTDELLEQIRTFKPWWQKEEGS